MIGAPDSRYPTMSILNTQRKVLPNEIRFSEAKLKLQQQELKVQSEKFKNT
jgi:hypothetical protein